MSAPDSTDMLPSAFERLSVRERNILLAALTAPASLRDRSDSENDLANAIDHLTEAWETESNVLAASRKAEVQAASAVIDTGQTFSLSMGAETIVRRAGDLAQETGRTRITSTCLLFAFASHDTRRDDTCSFVRKALIGTGRFDELFRTFRNNAHNDGPDFELHGIGRVTNNVRSVLNAAADLAGRCTRDIHQRHLFAALLTNPSTVAHNVLSTVLNLRQLQNEFRQFVHENVPTDSPVAWDEFLQTTAAPGATAQDRDADSPDASSDSSATALEDGDPSPTVRPAPRSRGEEPRTPQAWDTEFNAFRDSQGNKWSTTVGRILDLLWDEHRKAYQLSLSRAAPSRFQPRLTARSLFLAALLYGAKHQRELEGDPNGRGKTLVEVFRVCGLTDIGITQLLESEFFRPTSEERLPEESAIIGTDLAAVARRSDDIRKALGSDPYIGTRQLFLAMFEPPIGGMTGDLILRNDDYIRIRDIISTLRDSLKGNRWVETYETAEEWTRRINNLEATLPDAKQTPAEYGTRHEWNRDPRDSEGVGLRVDDYAEVLREVYLNAGAGEFALAVFGHWGRGKTFLMNRVAQHLEPDGYVPIFFSAWKYPTTPEVWVHLYETIADKACAGSGWVTLPRSVRTGIAKNGPWPILAALAAFAFSLTPKLVLGKYLQDVVISFVQLLGIGGLVWTVFLAVGIPRTKAKLSKHYLAATRHSEKLGLQATIGRDLSALLDGWMPARRCCSITALFAYVGISGWIAWSAWEWFSFQPGSSQKHTSIPVCVSLIVLVTMILLLLLVVIPNRIPKRLLLIVDDLDRCSSSQLLNVVESIKLLVEVPHISKRIQVAALADEDILGHSILTKHADLKQSACAAHFADARVIRENVEKLFTAHLRLPQLDKEEVAEILDLVLMSGRTANKEEAQSVAETVKRRALTAQAMIRSGRKSEGFPPDGADGSPVVLEGAPVSPGELRPDREPTPQVLGSVESPTTAVAPVSDHGQESQANAARQTTNLLGVGFRFGGSEEDAIRSAVQFLRDSNPVDPLGPRSIRGFVFRYQLARLLAIRLCPNDWSPRLITALLTMPGAAAMPMLPRRYERLKRIVAQVA